MGHWALGIGHGALIILSPPAPPAPSSPSSPPCPMPHAPCPIPNMV
ncbi:MAG: hypothetical protein RMY29_012420 [Nostoc sp. CreGUA01]|nr:hypothetical protein [Nostoc sp. CreGUA01]